MNPSRNVLGDTRAPVPAAPPTVGQRRRMPMAGLPSPVARARAFTAAALADWPWLDPGQADDTVLLVAELVANAVLHADGPLELVLDASPARLRIEVSDSSSVLPTPREPHRAGLPGGHGLFIVRRVADQWGAAPHSHGKSVWAEIDSRPADQAPRQSADLP